MIVIRAARLSDARRSAARLSVVGKYVGVLFETESMVVIPLQDSGNTS